VEWNRIGRISDFILPLSAGTTENHERLPSGYNLLVQRYGPPKVSHYSKYSLLAFNTISQHPKLSSDSISTTSDVRNLSVRLNVRNWNVQRLVEFYWHRVYRYFYKNPSFFVPADSLFKSKSVLPYTWSKNLRIVINMGHK